MKTKSHRAGRNGGFTLVELLVVVVIIVALAAVSFTAYRSIRAKANESTSASNMRQLGVAIQTFVADKNRYPSVGDKDSDEFQLAWDRIMMPFLGNPDFDYRTGKNSPILEGSAQAVAMGPAAKILHCPGDDADLPRGQMPRSYSMCPWTCTQGGPNFINGFSGVPFGVGPPPMRVADPSRAVVLVEHQSEKGKDPNVIGTGAYEHMFGFMDQPQRKIPANYHGSNQLVLFVDGHVAAIPGNITQTEWESKGYSPHRKR